MAETTSNTNPTTTASTEDSTNKSRTRNRKLSSVQVMFAVILTVGLMLALNFSSRIQADRNLERIHQQVVQEIEFLENQQEVLIEELTYVKGDAYVETWARDEGKMVREGEVLVLPQALESAIEPTPKVALLAEFETTPPEPENWQLWWALFFDSPPPKF
jgi:cell division protein FtsB